MGNRIFKRDYQEEIRCGCGNHTTRLYGIGAAPTKDDGLCSICLGELLYDEKYTVKPNGARTKKADREKELEAFIQDAAAFIRWAYTNGKEPLIPSTLSHDIGGLARREVCFSPRVTGYAKLEKGKHNCGATKENGGCHICNP